MAEPGIGATRELQDPRRDHEAIEVAGYVQVNKRQNLKLRTHYFVRSTLVSDTLHAIVNLVAIESVPRCSFSPRDACSSCMVVLIEMD